MITIEDVKNNKTFNPEHIGKAGEKISLENTKIIKNHKSEIPWKIIIPMIIAIITIFSTTLYIRSISKQNEEYNKQQVEHLNNQVQKNEKESLKENLEKVTEKVNIPTKITTEDLFGGYILGSTIYYPDEPQKTYIDFTIKAPNVKQEQASDETAKKILAAFNKSLPKINDTIEVKDKNKVTMEIYKKDDAYQTFLFYDNKPFAYINTDKNLKSVNYVTSEYVTNVAK